jgi:hypothetical protein
MKRALDEFPRSFGHRVFEAIQKLQVEDSQVWYALARDLFDLRRHCDADKLLPLGVYWKVQETDVVEDPGRGKLRVWIDPEGRYRLLVSRR